MSAVNFLNYHVNHQKEPKNDFQKWYGLLRF